ncbi:MAG: hypothetical protein HGB10_03910 [Coriobacteriia bacterium]|nr:hypothetical protein [Coriobacteriia bacterium]
MLNNNTVPLDDNRLSFLTTHLGEDGSAPSFSIDVEKAEDSHYSFSATQMSALDSYLVEHHPGATLVERLRAFIASFEHSGYAERELRNLSARLGIDMDERHFDSYDDYPGL